VSNKGLEGTPPLNPDGTVLNGDEEQTVKEEFLSLEGWESVPAGQHKRIKVMPCRSICHPNFHIVDGVEILAHYPHPDLFNAHPRPSEAENGTVAVGALGLDPEAKSL